MEARKESQEGGSRMLDAAEECVKGRARNDLWTGPHKDVVTLTCMHLFMSGEGGSQIEVGRRVNEWSGSRDGECGLCEGICVRRGAGEGQRHLF